MGKCCLHASLFFFDRIIIKVAGNQDRHKSSNKFDFGPDQTTNFGVTCPWMTKILHFRIWISLRPVGQSWSNFMCSITEVGERLHNVFRQIGSKLWWPWQQKAPQIGPDQTTNFGVTCPWMTKILHFRIWISLRPVGQSWSNFMCSITEVGERLHNVFRQIGSKLWWPWQQKA